MKSNSCCWRRLLVPLSAALLTRSVIRTGGEAAKETKMKMIQILQGSRKCRNRIFLRNAMDTGKGCFARVNC
ncbi:hypothetical protein K438DRAFT_2008483 [Mycena galopus ATCC 62051]|nr:hypothetical protein K438DRAFT_2008483 [Mycena galopus ATCC 62051]